jgi:uncharacterized membrane protein
VNSIEIACVLSSTGWVFALIGIVMLWYIGENATSSWSRSLHVVMYIGLFLTLAGFGACSAENRICELADRQTETN